MNVKELETVSYDTAADMLGVSKTTLFGATSRGVLTPLPRRSRKPGQLVKKQVELFIGKDLSLKWLTPEQAVTWQEIKNAVTAKKAPESTRAALAFELVEDKIAFAGAFMEGIADIAIEVVESMVDAAQAGDITPETLIEHVKKSPSFRRIMALLGIDMDIVPDETARAINAMAYEVADRVQAKLFAMLLKYAAHDAAERVIQQFIPAPSTEQDSTEQEHQDTESQAARAS